MKKSNRYALQLTTLVLFAVACYFGIVYAPDMILKGLFGVCFWIMSTLYGIRVQEITQEKASTGSKGKQ